VTPTQRKGAPDRERNGILRNLTPSTQPCLKQSQSTVSPVREANVLFCFCRSEYGIWNL
jgi:hypothetical protein